MAKRYLVLAILISAASFPARAEIYECVDQNGTKRFTNIAVEARGCRVLNVPGSAPAAPAQSALTHRPVAKAPFSVLDAALALALLSFVSTLAAARHYAEGGPF